MNRYRQDEVVILDPAVVRQVRQHQLDERFGERGSLLKFKEVYRRLEGCLIESDCAEFAVTGWCLGTFVTNFARRRAEERCPTHLAPRRFNKLHLRPACTAEVRHRLKPERGIAGAAALRGIKEHQCRFNNLP